MPDLFMSYSRKDKEFVKKLVESLKAQNRDVWVDWEDIPLTADWLQEIYKGIEGANNFIFIITPDSVASEVCGQELTHAIEHNKRLVPVLLREVTDYKLLNGALASHNWIYMRESDNFEESFKGLTSAIDTDLEHVKAHTRLLQRAMEWMNKNHNASFLLRGVDLQDGEKWLSESAAKQPRPTESQSKYLFESRKAENSRQRTLLMSVFGALIVSVILMVFAVYQTIQARENAARADLNAEFALARQLAAQSAVRVDSQLDLALLLSVEANDIASNVGLGGGEVRGTLVDALQFSPHLLTYLYGNHTSVKDISLSPDETLVASAHINGDIVITNLETREPIAVIPAGATTRRDTVSFSPDGQILASGGQDNAVTLWSMDDPTNPQVIGSPLTSYETALINVTFSADGTLLFTGSNDGRIIIWDISDAANPVQVNSFLSTEDAVLRDVALSTDEHWLVIGAGNALNYIWDVSDLAEPELVRVLEGPRGAINTVAFNPDGTLVASGGEDNDIILWDMATVIDSTVDSPTVVARLGGHRSFVVEIAFSPDGTLLASSGADEVIMLWDMATVIAGETDVRNIPSLLGHSNWINSLEFTDDGQTLISASDDATMIVWDILRRQQIGDTLYGHTDEVIGVAYSPDGNLIASASSDQTIILWDAHTHERIGTPLVGPNGRVESVAFSPDSRTIAATSNDLENQIILWDVSDPTNPQRIGSPINGHTQGLLIAVFSPDGTLLASAADAPSRTTENPILLWDVSDLAAPDPMGSLIGHSGDIKTLAFSPDGMLLASGAQDRSIILWDMNRESETFRQAVGEPFTGHTGTVRTVAFSPDGRTLASGSLDETVRLWDVATHQPLFAPLYGHTWYVEGVAFSPDGTLLASGSVDRTVILWDVATYQQIGRPLLGHTGNIRGLAFSPDGQTLVTASIDDTLVAWEVAYQTWRDRACALVNRSLTQTEWQQFVGEGTVPNVCPNAAVALPMPTSTP
jgi:WD40 repeat protein